MVEFSTPQGPLKVDLEVVGERFGFEGLLVHRGSLGRLVVEWGDGRHSMAHVAKNGDTWWVHVDGATYCWTVVEPGASAGDDGDGLVAPMPGKILEVLVQTGQSVLAGDALMVMEAMKMEHRIVAHADGVVTAVHFAVGDQVNQGVALLDVEETN